MQPIRLCRADAWLTVNDRLRRVALGIGAPATVAIADAFCGWVIVGFLQLLQEDVSAQQVPG